MIVSEDELYRKAVPSLGATAKPTLVRPYFFQRAAAPFLAISDLSRLLRLLALACPPRRPNDCAALSLPSSAGKSSGPTIVITGGFWSFDFFGMGAAPSLQRFTIAYR